MFRVKGIALYMHLQGFQAVASDKLVTLHIFQILDRVMYRVEWIRHQEREKKKLEDEKEKERGWLLPCAGPDMYALRICAQSVIMKLMWKY